MGKLTELAYSHFTELLRVRDEGRSFGIAGDENRKNGLAEFLWKLPDGRLLGDRQIPKKEWSAFEGATAVGERLTDAGRAALKQEGE